MQVGFRVDLFFDTAKIEKAVSTKRRVILNRTGAAARLTMRRSIRKAPKKKKYVATPPYPRYHVPRGIRDIQYTYDQQTEGVAVGAVRRRQSPSPRKGRTVYRSTKTVPQLLNEGGRAKQIRVTRRGKKTTKQVTFRKFDFVDRALPIAASKLAEFTDQIGLL